MKKHTESINHIDSTDWRWSTVELRWERKVSDDPEIWVRDHPPLPKWFIHSGGRISSSVLASLWGEMSSITMLNREIFWLSLEELENRLLSISGEFASTSSDVHEQTDSSVAEPNIESDDPQGPYDPMQALLAAQEGRPFNPQHQFETIEGGRFRAKH